MLESMPRNPTLLPEAAPMDVLESLPDSCFVLSEALDIVFCNSAWDRFAQENGGATARAACVISKNLLDVIAPALRDFYRQLFAQARILGQPVDHDYECSSPAAFRLYRMRIYPLESSKGFVVLNSLRVQRPHDRIASEPDDAAYIDSAGLIHMCANCRRTRRVADRDNAWDWVPAYLDGNRKNISHGVCPMCLEYYYRPFMDASESA
jgi:hypothetical protein